MSPPAARVLDPRAREALQRLEFRLRHRRAESLTVGGQRSVFRGRGMEFDQVVRYAYGDDIRDVDWNVTARLGETYRKVFVEEREVTVYVVVTDDPALQFGTGPVQKREVLLELAGFAVLLAAMKRERVALRYRAPGVERLVAPTRNRARILGAVGDLLASPAPDPAGAAGFRAMPAEIGGVPRGALILWFGEIPAAPPEAQWKSWKRRFDMVGVRVEDPWERALPDAGPMLGYDPVAHALVRVAATPTARESHARWRAQRERTWASWWPDPASRLVVDTAGDPLAALVGLLRSRGRGTAGRVPRG